MGTINKLTSLVFISFLVAGCGSSETTSTDGANGSNGGTLALKTAASNAELEAQIKASLINNYASVNNNYSVYTNDAIASEPTAIATSAESAADGSTATSSTNTQESAVDEADRMKTDGSHLYVSSIDQPSISIFKAETGAAPLVKKHDFTTLNSAPLAGFYLRDSEDQILAIAGDGRTAYPMWDMWFTPYYWQNRQTELFYLDVSDPAVPTQQAKLSIDGQLISSRRIGSYLYLATRHTPMPKGIVEYPQTQTDAAVNRNIINNASLSDLLPTYSVNDGEALSLFESGDCFLSGQQDLKPFRMSEYNDVLRIITYTGSQFNSESSPAHLYTLGEDAASTSLKMLGELPNASRPAPIGKPGEQIYASRFIGDKGYLVTFRLTDPLYILDLSNPSDPFIASELEIDGYSDYLHPVGENYLLGIGKDAIADSENGDGRGAWYQGVKLSLIDISNPSAPTEKQKIIIGGRGTETAVSQTHHALTTLQAGTSLQMALPISRHETNPASSYYEVGDPRYYFDWTRDELYRLNIDTSNGEISVLPSIIAENNESGINYYTRWEHDRSVMIGDEVYYLHKDEVRTTADITAP